MKRNIRAIALILMVLVMLMTASCGKKKTADVNINESIDVPEKMTDEAGNPISQEDASTTGNGANAGTQPGALPEEESEPTSGTLPPLDSPSQDETDAKHSTSGQTGAVFQPVTKPLKDENLPPWENGGKKPSQYTVEDHMALPTEHQESFYKWFSTHEAFMKWVYDSQKNKAPSEKKAPWQFPGSKASSDYTWAEYEALPMNHQIAFRESLGSNDEYIKWLEKAQPEEKEEEVVLPWENGGKKPSEYTLKEFKALSAAQQREFQLSFGSMDAFEKWMEKVEFDGADNPWNVAGAKQPSQYTWKEFEALTAAQQIAFQNSFGSNEAFFAWVEKVQSGKVNNPWNVAGAKQPSEYTWEEFTALTSTQQIAFQNSFGGADAFDAWLQKVRSNSVSIPWEAAGAKQPSEYTWEEFEELSPEQVIAFQNSFGSLDAFDQWLQKAQAQSATTLPWENGGKQPYEYTWMEFTELSAAQQIAFQYSFGSVDAFNQWLQTVNPSDEEDDIYLPWEDGGKQPSEYTWEEFLSLDPGQQIAFQKSFSSPEELDNWFLANQPE